MLTGLGTSGGGIVLNDITVVDLARWSFKAQAFVGDSFNLHCLLQGVVSADEGVVMDFSTAKSAIKRAVDLHVSFESEDSVATVANRNGFDHKLVLPSDPVFRPLAAVEQRQLEQTRVAAERISETHVKVRTEGGAEIESELPLDALRFAPADVLFDLDAHQLASLGRLIAEHLAAHLSHLHMQASLDRRPRLSMLEAIFPEVPIFPKGHCCTVPFSYTHGLARSSSYGCQNIIHGHHSFAVSADPNEALRIAEYLNGAYLFNGKHRLISGVSDGYARFRYESTQRGSFDYQIPTHASMQRVIDVGAEPTIENIARHCAKQLNLTRPFFVSEGLKKGCLHCP